jgi:hypothetical protein
MENSKLKYPAWQIPLQGAVQESDRDKLPGKIQQVEALIFERLQELQGSGDGVVERQAINDALELLRTVKHNQLNYPDWN